MGIVQDTLTGGRKMTERDVFLDKVSHPFYCNTILPISIENV